MPRTVEMTIPPEQTDDLVRELQGLPGLLGLRVQRGISLNPAGDVVSASVLTDHMNGLMRLLDRWGVDQDRAFTVLVSEPTCLMKGEADKQAIARDNAGSIWEEMECEIGKQSNMGPSMLLVMALAGVLAGLGMAMNAIDLVIAAMLIAPGFEPLTRLGLGVATHSAAWRRGIIDTLKGYGFLVGAAAITALALKAGGRPVLPGSGSYLPPGLLARYWSSRGPAALAADIAAAVAGIQLVTSHRTLLTSGVMVALALIPNAAIIGISIATWNTPILARSVERWSFDVIAVALLSTVIFAWRRRRIHRPRMWL